MVTGHRDVDECCTHHDASGGAVVIANTRPVSGNCRVARGADGENRRLGRIDNRREAVDAEHPEVGDRGGATGKVVLAQRTIVGRLCQRAHGFADICERAPGRVADHGRDKPVRRCDGYAHTAVARVEVAVAVNDVDGRMLGER